MKTEGVGFYSRVGLYWSGYGKLCKHKKLIFPTSFPPHPPPFQQKIKGALAEMAKVPKNIFCKKE